MYRPRLIPAPVVRQYVDDLDYDPHFPDAALMYDDDGTYWVNVSPEGPTMLDTLPEGYDALTAWHMVDAAKAGRIPAIRPGHLDPRTAEES